MRRGGVVGWERKKGKGERGQQEGRERRVVRWRKERGRKWKDNKVC